MIDDLVLIVKPSTPRDGEAHWQFFNRAIREARAMAPGITDGEVYDINERAIRALEGGMKQ